MRDTLRRYFPFKIDIGIPDGESLFLVGFTLVSLSWTQGVVLRFLQLIASVNELSWISSLFKLLFQLGFNVFHIVFSIPGSYNYSTELYLYNEFFDCGYPVGEMNQFNAWKCRGHEGATFSIDHGFVGLAMILVSSLTIDWAVHYFSQFRCVVKPSKRERDPLAEDFQA